MTNEKYLKKKKREWLELNGYYDISSFTNLGVVDREGLGKYLNCLSQWNFIESICKEAEEKTKEKALDYTELLDRKLFRKYLNS